MIVQRDSQKVSQFGDLISGGRVNHVSDPTKVAVLTITLSTINSNVERGFSFP
jgi:hypothetical protein